MSRARREQVDITDLGSNATEDRVRADRTWPMKRIWVQQYGEIMMKNVSAGYVERREPSFYHPGVLPNYLSSFRQ
ncbi:unnamed protein product [Nezara viridula]|uniref:Uncharacterized protein n=1 Tax=Nezara viridula TaxID=85310 RepID=A0A9P0EEC5_NEZVI|nr:unnamed protein product [Nezara viridula]